MNTVIDLVRAIDFAARMHSPQKRKGKREEPYVNHLTEVALLLAEATEGKDVNLVMAGYLHDTIEDCADFGNPVTYDDLAKQFGTDVAGLVLEATDDKSLPKEERKLLQVKNAPKKSDRAKMLKVADKIANLRAILDPQTAPPSWPLQRKQAYFEWARQVVEGCRGQNTRLDALFDAEYARKGQLE